MTSAAACATSSRFGLSGASATVWLFWLSAGAIGALLIAGFEIYSRLTKHLRANHESTWNRLGKPNIVGDAESKRDALALLKFLFSGEYSSLNDPVVTSLCRKLIALNIGIVVCLVAVGVLGTYTGVFK